MVGKLVKMMVVLSAAKSVYQMVEMKADVIEVRLTGQMDVLSVVTLAG